MLKAKTTTATGPTTSAGQTLSAPTKTRWLILFLISLMYLICYMDRSNISVAQPEIAKAFGLSKNSMGVSAERIYLVVCAGTDPGGMAGGPVRPEESPHGNHVLVVGRRHDDGCRAWAWLVVCRKIFFSDWAKPGPFQSPAEECNSGIPDRSVDASRARRISSAVLRWR